MSEETGVSVEKILRLAVIGLLIAIVAAMVLLVKDTFFFKQTRNPRTSIEKQLIDAQKAIQEDPSNLNARLMLGITYSQMGEYDKAEREYINVINADKKMYRAYYLLALNYEKKGEIDEAIKVLKQNDDEQSLYQLGCFYVRQKNYGEAVTTLKKALKKRPEGSDTLYYLGLAYEKQGNKAEAVTNYEKALSFAPDFDLAKKALGRVK
jgi:tetratricopeptide (TPR) repeat protein